MEQSVSVLIPALREPTDDGQDLDLVERVELALRMTGYGPLRGLAVFALAGVVRLEGRVPSYHLKQVAQAMALGVPGTCRVKNNLEVVRPG